MERERINQAASAILRIYQGDPSPKGLTEFYATIVNEPTVATMIDSFLKVEWKNSPYYSTAAKVASSLLIAEMFPEIEEEVTEKPTFTSELRFLFQKTNDLSLIKALVLMAGAEYYKDQEGVRVSLFSKARNSIDESVSKLKLNAMELYASLTSL